MKNKKAIIFAFVLFVIALALTVYPVVSNAIAEKYHSDVKTEYFESIGAMDNSSLDEERRKAEEYNALLLKGTGEKGASYDELLNVNGNGIMGYIEIPILDVYLPIAHGTDAETLEKSVGHVIGSSLPVGGEGTHAVLSGHSGMAGQKMFSDLEALEISDVFYIHCLDETLAYKVAQIDVVLPEDTSLLEIKQGMDYVTLVTCTPFGVNTHRLLIRGERVPYTEAELDLAIDMEDVPPSTWTDQYFFGVALGFTALAVVGIPVAVYEMKREEKDA